MKLFFYFLLISSVRIQRMETEKEKRISQFDSLFNGREFKDIRPLIINYFDTKKMMVEVLEKTELLVKQPIKKNEESEIESYTKHFSIESLVFYSDKFMYILKNRVLGKKINLNKIIGNLYYIDSYSWHPVENTFALLAINPTEKCLFIINADINTIINRHQLNNIDNKSNNYGLKWSSDGTKLCITLTSHHEEKKKEMIYISQLA